MNRVPNEEYIAQEGKELKNGMLSLLNTKKKKFPFQTSETQLSPLFWRLTSFNDRIYLLGFKSQTVGLRPSCSCHITGCSTDFRPPPQANVDDKSAHSFLCIQDAKSYYFLKADNKKMRDKWIDAIRGGLQPQPIYIPSDSSTSSSSTLTVGDSTLRGNMPPFSSVRGTSDTQAAKGLDEWIRQVRRSHTSPAHRLDLPFHQGHGIYEAGAAAQNNQSLETNYVNEIYPVPNHYQPHPLRSGESFMRNHGEHAMATNQPISSGPQALGPFPNQGQLPSNEERHLSRSLRSDISHVYPDREYEIIASIPAMPSSRQAASYYDDTAVPPNKEFYTPLQMPPPSRDPEMPRHPAPPPPVTKIEPEASARNDSAPMESFAPFVERFRSEQLDQQGSNVIIRADDLSPNTIKLVMIGKSCTVAELLQATLFNKLHVGDVILAVNHMRPRSVEFCFEIFESCELTEIPLKVMRVAHGMMSHVRLSSSGKAEELGLEFNNANFGIEVTAIKREGVVARSGHPGRVQTPGITNGGILVSWGLIEVNGRPVNLRATSQDVWNVLHRSGQELALVFIPMDIAQTFKGNDKYTTQLEDDPSAAMYEPVGDPM